MDVESKDEIRVGTLDFFKEIYSVKEKEKTERKKETEVYYLINRIIFKDNFSVWAKIKQKQTEHKYDSGEFDPGSGWTLAIGLTHASRGAAWSQRAEIDGDRRTGA